VRTIQSKITLTYIGISLVVTALLGILLSLEIEKSYFDRLNAQLLIETRTIESLLSGTADHIDTRGQGEAILHTLSFTTNSRITLVGVDGAVIYDSSVPDSLLSTLENHGSRPEIAEARMRGEGLNIRESKSTGENLLYFARKIHLEKEGASPFASVEFIRVAISYAEVSEAVSEIRLKTLVAGILVLIVGFVASRFLARQIAKPVIEIGEIVKKIQEGDLDQKLPIHSRDEIGRLAAVINDMTDKLKSDIEQLKKLERVRTEFLGNVSHELRTPIFSLKGFLETLLEGAINDPAVNVKFVEKAYNHANRLDTLLSDLIEISRIESGDMKMSYRYFDAVTLLRQVEHDAADLAGKKKQELKIDVPEGEIQVLGDKDRLKLAVGNIVDNAIKYSPDGASIEMRLILHDQTVTLTVKDNGPGIEPEHLPRIFERFYRIDKNRSREVGGTGLGLAIVKHIVEAHGSRVVVTSQPGLGTAFSFDLKR
jgi:two-component system, OmpR family, phosphate regulon sensor histidine kinase PhoR